VNATDKLMAWAQIGLSVMFILGTFVIIGSYELGYAKFSVDQQKDFSSTMNWLTGACLIIIYFWFQRQRTAGIPEGTMVTQVHTAADGSVTKTVGPSATTILPINSTGGNDVKVTKPTGGPAIGKPVI
jgi:hypothetical protein